MKDLTIDSDIVFIPAQDLEIEVCTHIEEDAFGFEVAQYETELLTENLSYEATVVDNDPEAQTFALQFGDGSVWASDYEALNYLQIQQRSHHV